MNLRERLFGDDDDEVDADVKVHRAEEKDDKDRLDDWMKEDER